MRPWRARVYLLGLLCGAVLAACPPDLRSAPEEPAPAGYAWEDLKEIHSRLLKPEKWLFRREVQGPGWTYYFSPQPFTGEGELKKGLTLMAVTKVKDQEQKSADEYAATMLAEIAAKEKVLKGWTRKGQPAEPFTTYALVGLTNDGEEDQTYMVKIVCVANHETDTLYAFVLASPRAEWKDVEEWGEKMIANLRLDPKF